MNIFVGRIRGHLDAPHRGRMALALAILVASGCGEAAPGPGAGEGGQISTAEPAGGPPTESVPPDALQVGSRYRFTRSTPVVRDLDPGDPAMAMAEPILLPESAVVLVVERIESAGTIWYRVQTEAGEATTGWVSLQALEGRTISAAP